MGHSHSLARHHYVYICVGDLFMALASFLHAAHGWAEGHRWSSGGEGASQRAAGWAGPPDCHRTMASVRGVTG